MQLTRFHGRGFLMAFRGNVLLFFLLGIQQKNCIAVADRADGKININIAIFFNASDRFLRSIVQNSKDNFLGSQRGNNLLNENFTFHDNPWWQDMTNSGRSQIGLNDSLSVVWNISSKIQGAVFVDINSDSIFLSSLLEQSGIPTIGAFQRSEQLRTQESPADFTRVAVPSIKYYAQVIWKFMKKIERSSLCMVLSADSDGEVLADAIARMAKDEKWSIKRILWLAGNSLVSIETEIESIISQQSDVVVVHSRDKDNEPLFRALKTFNATGSIWILTQITEYGISHLDDLPAGLIKINARKREVNLDDAWFSDVIYDALLLFQTAFTRAQRKTPYQMEDKDECFEENTSAREVQDLVKIHLRETFIEGRSSMFAKPSLYEKSETSFEIWNLRLDVNGAKYWTLIGLSTPTGLALDTFMGPNGSTIIAPTVPVTHTLRVPINEYHPWVQIEDPRLDSRGMHYCTGRSQLCYKFYNASRMKKTTRCCYGVSIDLLVMMQNELGFRSEIYFTPDGNYGVFDEEKKAWNGIVQEVLSGQADFAIDISMNAIRQQYLDFAHPFIHLALNILVLKDLEVNEEIQWNSWLEPFQYQLWFSILGFINFILIVIWWIDRKSPMGHSMNMDSADDGFTLLDSMTYVWGVAFGKDIGAEKTPHSGSARCVSAFFAFFALIVVNTYCANLMAFLVQEKFDLPITGIRDTKIRHPSLTPPKGFRLGIQRGSQEASYFKFHSEEIFREIYHVNLKVNFVNSFEDGLEKLKNREINGLVGDYLSLSQVANNDENCSYSLAGPNFFNFGLGLALRKGSLWLQDVSQAVLKHQENGSIKAIESRWFNKKSCDSKPFNRLEIINLSGLFMAVVIVIAFCVLAIFVEVCIVVLMIKFGDKLGRLGKFTKRFVFNVKKGEEDQFDMQYSFLLRRPQNAKWDVPASHVASTDLEELGFHNNRYPFPTEQTMALGDMNRNGTIHHWLHGDGDAKMNGVVVHEHTNGRTKSTKLNGMVTKL